MTTHAREKLFTFAAVLAAAVASVATSAVDWKLGHETSGDVTVDDQERVVRVLVRSSIGAQIRVEAKPDTNGKQLEPPIVVVVSPAVAYQKLPEADAGGSGNADTLPTLTLASDTTTGLDLRGEKCTRNCVEDVELHFKREAGQPAVRVHWVVKAGISDYGDGNGDVPPDAYLEVTEQK